MREQMARSDSALEQAQESARRHKHMWEKDRAALHKAAADAVARANGLSQALEEQTASTEAMAAASQRYRDEATALRAELASAEAATVTAEVQGDAQCQQHARDLKAAQAEAASQQTRSRRAVEAAELAKAEGQRWAIRCQQLERQHNELDQHAAKAAAAQAREAEAAEAAAQAASESKAALASVRKELAATRQQLQGEVAAARRAAAKVFHVHIWRWHLQNIPVNIPVNPCC